MKDKEIDLTFVKIVNENNERKKKLIKEQEAEMALKELEQFLATIDKEKKEEFLRNFYQNSIQDENNSKKIHIHGKMYAVKKGLSIALAVAGVILGIKAAKVTLEVSEYNRVLNQKIENRLTGRQQELYQQEHQNILKNIKDVYQQIQEEKKELDPEHYNFFENNIQEKRKEYLPFDGDSLFNVTEKTQDAIDAVTDRVIEDYQKRGR